MICIICNKNTIYKLKKKSLNTKEDKFEDMKEQVSLCKTFSKKVES